jgi:O-antigen ligase
MSFFAAGVDDANMTLRFFMRQFPIIVIPYLFFRSNLSNGSEYRSAIACFGAASIFLSVFAIYEARFGWSIFENMEMRLGIVQLSKNMLVRGGMMRASATMGGPLGLACFLTVGFFAVACSRDFFRNQIGYYGAVGVTLIGLLASQSRGSIIALFVSAVVLFLALRKRSIAAAIATVAITVLVALPVLEKIFPSLAERLGGGGQKFQGKYFDYRGALLDRGLQEAARHPIIGQRMHDLLNSLADIIQGQHIVDLVNVYLVVLMISGIVGFIPFVGLIGASGVRASVGFKRINDPALLRARAFVLAAFTVILIQFSFVSFIDRIPMNFGLIMIGVRLIVWERRFIGNKAATMVLASRSPSPVSQWVYAGGAPAAS